MRWIWIDRFTEFRPGKSARAVKNVSLAEDPLADHFPGYPIMPASLILEGLAQTGGILVGETSQFQEKVVLAKINSARFFREVLPGEQLVYDAEVLSLRPEGAAVLGRAGTLGLDAPDESPTPVAEAEIFFAYLDRSRSQQLFGDHNFVFGSELKQLLRSAQALVSNEPG